VAWWAPERLRLALPFAMRGVDSDNGREFVNDLLGTFCTDHGIEFAANPARCACTLSLTLERLDEE
jgi:hypothetical protein